MKIFNEETTSRTAGGIIQFETAKEGQIILQALTDFKKQNPRRKAAHKLIDQLDEKLAVW